MASRQGAHLPHVYNPEAFPIHIVEVLSDDIIETLSAWGDAPELSDEDLRSMGIDEEDI